MANVMGARIEGLFEAQVDRNPDAIAVRFEGAQLTYRELDARANQIAHRLRSLGVGPDSLVPIVVERSLEMLPALLGILKADGAYVPLDPGYPHERLAFMLADCAPRVIVAQGQFVERIPPGQWEVLRLDAIGNAPPTRPERRGSPQHLAYGIYTSGSTGTPKCALVEHRSVVNLWLEERLDASARVIQNTPLTFDPSVLELFGPLAAGGCVIVPRPGGHRDIQYLLDMIQAEQVTSVTFVPSLLEIVVGERALADCRSLRRVLCGGELLSYDLQQRFFARSHAELHNAYGPTEATVYASRWRCRRDSDDHTVPIGRAIVNTKLHVLDEQQHPVPAGEAGELYIAGAGVARGYLNRPDLTAERFVVIGGERMYRTGDVVRVRTDGNLEFLGRTDDQVKIRGFRVELGEIDACLRAHPAIGDVVVLARDKQIVAYVVPETVPIDELREHVRRRLPEFMMPASFVALRAFELLESGKIDRNALPAPAVPQVHHGALETPMQTLVADIWRAVLGVDEVGADDDFFDLGGHSLLAIQVLARVRAATSIDVSMRAFFDAPTVRALAALIDAGSQAPAEVIERVPGTEPTRLSSSQEQLWFLHALDPASVAYTVPFVLRLRGTLDEPALARSIDEIVRRHDVLRATITGDVPHMHVTPHTRHVLRAEPVASLEAAEAIANAEARTPFDLERGPLLRTRLLRISADDHVLVVTLHHIIADGWSCAVFERDLVELYAGRPLPELAIRFADYASWEREHAGGPEALAYWKAHLAGVPLVLEMPADRPRPPVQTFTGARQRFVLDATTVDAIAKLSRAEGVTPFMTLFAVFGVLLHRYTGQDQLVVGVPIAHRDRADVEHLIGMFVNTLAIAADFTGNPTFHELLQRVRATTLAGFAHQDLPFNKLVEAVQPARDLGRTPIAQVMFAYQTAAVQAPASEVTITRMPIDNGTSKFELMLDLTPHGAGLAGFVEYNSDLYDAATIARFVQHFERLVGVLVDDPQARVSEVPLLTPAERDQLAAWNATERVLPDRRIEELFEDQVARTPDAVAVRFEDAQLSYRELDARANQLAHRLRALGVTDETLVPIFVERSLEMLPALFGILKAGGAYVPLDPEYPPERLAFMLEDCAPRVVITQARLRDKLPAGPWHVLELDAALDGPMTKPPRIGTPASLAYGIYTSGSTGKPKCALVMHHSAVNLMHEETYHLDATDRVLQKTPLTFDASVPELFGPFRVGARLVVARPDGHRDVAYLLDVIRAEQITSITFVPSLLDVFASEPDLAQCTSLRRVLVGGEALSFDVVARFFSRTHAELHNTYGPTETTVTSAFWPCVRDSVVRTIPIGRPVGNTQLHVLDARQQPVPIGVLGELYIGGIGLARGYLNRPELTAERFVVVGGERMYRTGDVVRYRADGNLEFLGRTDHQVKVRGFRIELGEIEASLRAHAAVRDVIVLAREDVPGQKHLVAYVVPAVAESELRDLLKSKLPDYMVPSAFVFLDAFPLMVNGKVDRKALPAPARAAQALVAPRNAIEEKIAKIWREVLGLDEVGVTDDFFSLGGHSLLAMQVVAKIRQAFDVDVPLRMLLQARTIEEQARLVTRKADHLGRLIVRTDNPIARATIAQEQFYYLSADDPDPAAYFTRAALAIDGPLDRALLAQSYAELVAYHGIFRTGFREIEGLLHQIVLPEAPPPDFTVVERLGDEAAAIERSVGELLQHPCDLARGLGLIRAQLIAFAPERHVLVVLIHHIASDGTVFLEQLFAGYSRLRAGAASALPDARPLQYIDFAHARAQWSATPTAKAHQAYWDERTQAPPLELPTDVARTQVDARRDALPFGIAADLNYPPDYRPLPAEVRTAVIQGARALKTTPYMVYLGALAWLFHRAGNETVSIQTTYNHRPEYPALDGVQGPFAWWTHVRIDASNQPTFAELVRRTSLAVDGARENGIIEDYFQRVGHPLRRSAFNYLPMGAMPEVRATDLRIARMRQPFPTWKRHWDIHLTVLDDPSETILVWTGMEALFRRETVRALLDRYIEILARAAG